MSYQVLARKWRPKSFEDMVGQTHVVRALRNALDQGLLHHAYLFTGTRGVGKTTLARILSKALNCEQGVTSRPCGQCAACREIDEGRFVDLLEVDAASRTKVDQTRDLLDNVPFAPARGRYKVYLIDEVHMFSGHSFNALLKTLEEPPPHVKFLLATTDPQKVPVTVLSRCLQFNLKRLVPEEIAHQLAHVLQAEGIGFDEPAAALLARAADGSMRDGLSLLDQAIAFGGGEVRADAVRAMLGTVSRDLSLDLVETLARRDGPGLLDQVARIAELTPDFTGVLQEMLIILHRVALAQQVPSTVGADDPDRERLRAMAETMAPEDVQLFYQIGLIGQQDLPLAPDPRTGIEMVLLRMLAFRPDPAVESRHPTEHSAAASVRSREAPPPVPGRGAADGSKGGAVAALADARRAISAERSGRERPQDGPAIASGQATPERVLPGPIAPHPATGPTAAETGVTLRGPEDWHALVGRLGLRGVASELASNCDFAGLEGGRLTLVLDQACEHMRVASAEQRLRAALAEVLGGELRVDIRTSPVVRETPARRRARSAAERQAAAETLMRDDPVARMLQDKFDARWVSNTIEPMDEGWSNGGGKA
jgi:DNA polymerase-3 subunit gamma/tau